MAQCIELTLLPDINESDFEKAVFVEVFKKLAVLRRNVRGTLHRLLKQDGKDGSQRKYIWLVVVSLVGATPETAGEGPDVLASDLKFLDEAARLLAEWATIASFTEIVPAEQAASAAQS